MQELQSIDRTYAEFKGTITTEVALNISIILACVPFLKLLLDNLQSGWSTSNVQTGAGYRNSFWTDGVSAGTGGLAKFFTPLGRSREQTEERSQKSDISLVQLSTRGDLSITRDISRDRSNSVGVA